MGHKNISDIYIAVVSKVKQNIFPSIIISLFLILTIFGISGSSMASFDQYVSATTPGVLAGQPRLVRSDEWMWQTQDLMIQKINNYPEINKKIGLGENMSIVVDVPFKSVYALFKPQNLFFFIMPFSHAFAAKWWFMSLVLTLGFYFLIISLFPKRRLLASLGALLLLFNPFTQWWYQSVTLLCIGYALWACLFVIKLFNKDGSKKLMALYCAGLAYSVLCFIFLLYPPFLIPTASVIIAVLAGYFYYRYFVLRTSIYSDRKKWLGVALSMIVVLLISSAFYISHKQVITDVENTVYPGVRNITSGDSGTSEGSSFNILTTFSAPILFNLQNTQRAYTFYANQSESARIAAINLLLVPVILFQVLKKARKDRKLVDYLLLSTCILACIFMVRMFTPLFNLPFRLLLFNEVQNQRLAIGLAVLCAIQLVLLGVTVAGKLNYKKAAAVAFIAFAVLLDSSLEMAHQNPGFISGKAVLLACMIVGLSIFLLLQKKYFIYGFILFLLFNVYSSINVNPIYDRSEPVEMVKITKDIASKYPDNKSWVVFDSAIFGNIPALAGKQSFTGIQYYPQLTLWRMFDSSKQATQAYNRYAHVIFTADNLPGNVTFYNQPTAADELYVHFSCSMAAKLPNFGYVLSLGPVNTNTLNCLKIDGTTHYANITMNVYKYINKPIDQTAAVQG